MFLNKFMKLLCSLPIVLLITYYIPFLGFILIVTRYFVYGKNKSYYIPISFITLGILIIIPSLLSKMSNISIPYLDKIVGNSLYSSFLSYSKLLIIFGIIFTIVSYIFNKLISSASGFVSNYIREQENMVATEKGKNDLVMQEKREKAKNTGVVVCPNCGASNILSEQTGVCQFCRTPLSQKK